MVSTVILAFFVFDVIFYSSLSIEMVIRLGVCHVDESAYFTSLLRELLTKPLYS